MSDDQDAIIDLAKYYAKIPLEQSLEDEIFENLDETQQNELIQDIKITEAEIARYRNKSDYKELCISLLNILKQLQQNDKDGKNYRKELTKKLKKYLPSENRGGKKNKSKKSRKTKKSKKCKRRKTNRCRR